MLCKRSCYLKAVLLKCVTPYRNTFFKLHSYRLLLLKHQQMFAWLPNGYLLLLFTAFWSRCSHVSAPKWTSSISGYFRLDNCSTSTCRLCCCHHAFLRLLLRVAWSICGVLCWPLIAVNVAQDCRTVVPCDWLPLMLSYDWQRLIDLRTQLSGPEL